MMNRSKVPESASVRAPARSRSGTRWAVRSLPGRLLTAQIIVLLAGVATAGAVAAIVGPPLFHHHLLEAGMQPSAPEINHVEEAYRTANFLTLGVAVAIAAVCALSVTWFFGTRLRRPLDQLTDVAEHVSKGDYGARVELYDAGPELESLATAFNSMAARIEHTEETRRRLLSDLAHELRTPIATLGAWVDGLDDGVTAWGADAASVVRQQLGRLQRLAEDMGEVSRAEEGRLNLQTESVAVSDLLLEAARAHAAAYAAAGLRLTIQDESAGATVEVDRERMAQVMANLLNNARRHTPSGGSVTLGACGNIGSPGGSRRVDLTVTDTGEGIEAEKLDHVFERFFRGDPSRRRAAASGEPMGSGIGLTITKALVEAHGGRVTASSDGIGRGAQFTVSLPACSS